MKFKYKTIFIIVLLLITGIFPVIGQVVVEKSNERTIISGKQYYLHTVKKGENGLFDIKSI